VVDLARGLVHMRRAKKWNAVCAQLKLKREEIEDRFV
jgi:hypothetical protein